MMPAGQMAALVAASLGMAFGSSGPRYNTHEPRDLQYTDSGKPMSKRRKRRLRAKAKEQSQ